MAPKKAMKAPMKAAMKAPMKAAMKAKAKPKAKAKAARAAKVKSLGTLTYFPLYAKGLAPALCAEFSGLPWKSNKETGFVFDKWAELKASGKCPFGQLPILETEQGMVIGQAVAICNYIGKVAGLEGKDADEFAMSQMLLAEGEDLYNAMQKYQPTMFVKEKADTGKLWSDVAPAEMKKLEGLLQNSSKDTFTSSGTTVGELYLFAMLHQMVLVTPDALTATPKLHRFYEFSKALPQVAKVLAGESAMGELAQYFQCA
eukprot:TRINITY_DN79449_c0_g1_i1.p1 TRINITY_DN79449_c0_g1~~TRINITY_DN79449_c0_g1_i1.p1  ORF type:complete len:258 (+),score=79.49 TRINITY_DN79449_c0_g1_i1:58-831(+)